VTPVLGRRQTPGMRALRAAQLYDGTAFVGAATVVVDGGSIIGVEPGHPDLPAGVEVTAYDGTLLPGLFDCHVHLVSDASLGSLERAGESSDDELDAMIASSLRDQVAGGVTTVQDLGDCRYRTARARSLPGLPRVLAAGPPITVPGGHCHYLGGAAEGVAGVRAAVEEHVAHGVDVLKVMASGGMLTAGTDTMAAQFTPEELRAVVDAGHAAGLRVLAHAHALTGVWQALECGVDGIEHFSCLTDQGPVTPDALLDAVSAAGLVGDPTLGVDPAGIPSPDRLPPGFRATMERMGLRPHHVRGGPAGADEAGTTPRHHRRHRDRRRRRAAEASRCRMASRAGTRRRRVRDRRGPRHRHRRRRGRVWAR
jgi:imidazolonepropionase-like amidohydrolase